MTDPSSNPLIPVGIARIREEAPISFHNWLCRSCLSSLSSRGRIGTCWRWHILLRICCLSRKSDSPILKLPLLPVINKECQRRCESNDDQALQQTIVKIVIIVVATRQGVRSERRRVELEVI
jgi:hypothetical protein